MLKTIQKHPGPFIFIFAALIYSLQSIAWPLSPGRDLNSYLLYYLDVANPDPLYTTLMLYIKPAAPFFHGLLLDLSRHWFGSALLDEFAMGLLFSLSMVVFYRVGLHWSPTIGWLAALALCLQPGYATLYHTVSTEGLFAFAFLLWVWFICHTFQQPRLSLFALHGLAACGLLLIRSSSQFLILFAFFPLILPLTFWQKVQRSLLFLGISGAFILAFSAYNWVRFDDFSISRTGLASLPLTRIFRYGQPPIRAENGPYSAALITAIQNDLLKREPYLSYGIDLQTFLSAKNSRMFNDLMPLSDRTWGWDADYQPLFRVGLETIRSDPLVYLAGVIRTFGGAFLRNVTLPAPTPRAAKASSAPPPARDANNLPVPTEGQLIPASNTWPFASSPSQRIEYDWKTFYQTGLLLIKDPVLRQHARALDDRLQGLLSILPSRKGSPGFAFVLNKLSAFYPPMALWVALGMLSLVIKPHSPADGLLAFLLGFTLIVLLVTYAGINLVLQYRLPFDPIFILAGLVGIRKINRAWAGSRTRLPAQVNPQ